MAAQVAPAVVPPAVRAVAKGMAMVEVATGEEETEVVALVVAATEAVAAAVAKVERRAVVAGTRAEAATAVDYASGGT